MAEDAYGEAILREPENVEAWEFLIRRRIASREMLGAIALLGKTPAPVRSHPALQLLAGQALHALGQLNQAEVAFRAATSEILVARLYLASVLDELGREEEALRYYFGGLSLMQQKGACRDEGSTPPAVRPLVLRAMRKIDEGRGALFRSLMEPHIRRHGAESMRRIESGLEIYLGKRAAGYADSRQRPTFFYMPDLPPLTYYDLTGLDWVTELQSKTPVIRDELVRLMMDGNGIEAVHQLTGEALEPYVRSSQAGGNWKGAYFYRHGQINGANAVRCPATFSAIEALPLARVRDHGPEVLFSVLDPGTEILPHRGVTNTRLVLHLPLIVPEECALDVSGEVHSWREGECILFDDTFEHQAWNRSSRTRVILIADVWNPNLTEAEREALTELVGGIGDFNRSCDL